MVDFSGLAIEPLAVLLQALLVLGIVVIIASAFRKERQKNLVILLFSFGAIFLALAINLFFKAQAFLLETAPLIPFFIPVLMQLLKALALLFFLYLIIRLASPTKKHRLLKVAFTILSVAFIALAVFVARQYLPASLVMPFHWFALESLFESIAVLLLLAILGFMLQTLRFTWKQLHASAPFYVALTAEKANLGLVLVGMEKAAKQIAEEVKQ